jgi:P pilus assembly protein, pilin FimA
MQGMKSGLLTLLLLPSLALAENIWTVTLAGGDVRFQGEIIAEACRVETGDQQMIVNMGQISSNRFHSAGEDANPVPFDIHLQECNTAVSERVGITFHGIADGKNPDVLSVGEGPNIATGVSVALFDDEDRLIPINTPPRRWNRLYKGPTTIHLVAKYRATGNQVTGGLANANAWFALTYQ